MSSTNRSRLARIVQAETGWSYARCLHLVTMAVDKEILAASDIKHADAHAVAAVVALGTSPRSPAARGKGTVDVDETATPDSGGGADRYAEWDDGVLWNILGSVHNDLIAEYVAARRAAATEEEAEQWMQRMIAARDEFESARDRGVATEHMHRWEAEIVRVKALNRARRLPIWHREFPLLAEASSDGQARWRIRGSDVDVRTLALAAWDGASAADLAKSFGIELEAVESALTFAQRAPSEVYTAEDRRRARLRAQSQAWTIEDQAAWDANNFWE